MSFAKRRSALGSPAGAASPRWGEGGSGEGSQQAKILTMMEDNKQLALRIDGAIQSASQEMTNLRAELTATNRRLAELGSSSASPSVMENNQHNAQERGTKTRAFKCRRGAKRGCRIPTREDQVRNGFLSLDVLVYAPNTCLVIPHEPFTELIVKKLYLIDYHRLGMAKSVHAKEIKENAQALEFRRAIKLVHVTAQEGNFSITPDYREQQMAKSHSDLNLQ
ncbi:hypothetical protein KIL84_022141 [Mauremys mutica]|uniref:Uncharacterized protein n=1 Tax=Mauremys mutica TaxID=74926 RepID=A0A9D3X9T4_9SAUR|nr:hypothetical protein KIL84_022141 [Mauremys mutica]